jgi:hypothetical protein
MAPFALGAVATIPRSVVSRALIVRQSGRYASGEWHRVQRTFSKNTTWPHFEQEKIFIVALSTRPVRLADAPRASTPRLEKVGAWHAFRECLAGRIGFENAELAKTPGAWEE